MSELKNDIEKLRVVLMRLRPTVRPYIIGGLWFFLMLSIVWDIKRYLGGHPRSVGSAAFIYAIAVGTLLFDRLAERRLRRKK